MSEFKKKNLIEYVFDAFKVSFSGHSILLDGTEFKKTEFGDMLGADLLDKTKMADTFYAEYRTEADRKRFWADLYIAIKRRSSSLKKAEYSSDSLPESRAMVIYTPVVNVENGTAYLVNPNTRELSLMSYDVWMRTLGKDDKKAAEFNTRLARFVYDPYNIGTFVMEPFEDYELLKVNTYRAPAWRKREGTKTECPERIWKVLTHLFPNEDALTYILDWLYFALMSRNEAYLVLNGAKGIGKGVLCSISEMLVGTENYSLAHDNFMENGFNAVLDRKRVILIDEFKVDKVKHTRLKRYINKFLNIEKKGIDADRSREIFNSYIISNNDVTDMYLEYDDRRFSAVDMTDKMLTDIMPVEEITQLVLDMEDENADIAYDFGYFIYNRGAVAGNEFSVFKGERYHKLVECSLKAWQKFILNKILTGDFDTLDINRLKREYKIRDGRLTFPTEVQRVQDFLNNYRYGGDKKLGEVVKEGSTWIVRVSPWVLKDNKIVVSNSNSKGGLL